MEENKKNGFGTAGLVLGIIAIVVSFMPFFMRLAFLTGGLAIIFAIIALVQKADKGKNFASIILGVLAILIAINIRRAIYKSFDAAGQELERTIQNGVIRSLPDDISITIGDSDD